MTYNQNMIDGLNLLKKLEEIIDETITNIYTQARLKSNDDELPFLAVIEIWKKSIDLDNDLRSTKIHIDYMRSVLIRMRPSEEMNNEDN
jgi:hypothetical protein